MFVAAEVRRWLWRRCGQDRELPERRGRLAGRRRQGFRQLVVEPLELRRLLSIYSYDAILDGQAKSGTIVAAGDQHVYQYVAASEIEVTLSLSRVSSVANPRVGLYTRPYAPSKQPLATVTAGDKSSPIHLAAGSYEIAINDNSAAKGAYAVALEGLNPPSRDAITMNRGDLKNGKIDGIGEVDEFTFTAPAGSKVTLSLAEPDSGSSLRPHADLYSPSGEKIKLYAATTGGRVDDVSDGNKVISDPLASGGTYVVQVYDDNYTHTGDYHLAVEGLITPSADAVTILWGETRSDAIASGEIDEYKFAAFAGNVVTVSLSEQQPGTDTELWAELYAPSGQQVQKLFGSNGPDEVENGYKVVYPLPENGTYVLQVYDYDYTHTENYAVTLEGLKPHSPDPDAQQLILGVPVSASGQINAVGEVDEIYFNLNAADLAAAAGAYAAKLTFESDETVDYKPKATLYSPSGNKVGTDFATGNTKTPALTEAGDYVLQVYDNDYTHTGGELVAKGRNPNYTVTLQEAQPPAVVSVSVNVATVSDSVVGSGKFTVTVVFDERMDTLPAAQPSLVFSSPLVTGGLTPTLTQTMSSWPLSNTWTVTYDVHDRDVELSNVTIDVVGAKDVVGNPQQNYAPQPEFDIDTRKPSVASLTPGDNVKGVAVNANLVMTFHEKIGKGTGNIVIRRSGDASALETVSVLSGQVTLSNTLATINPSATLAVATGYYVEVEAGAFLDLAGNRFGGISGATSWNFTTAGPPTVVNLSPPDNATDFPADANLVMTFNESVQQGAGAITLQGPSGNVDASVTFAGATVTINPTPSLEYDTVYYVEVPPGAVKNLAGIDYAGIAGPTGWNFTTGSIAVPQVTLTVSPPSVSEGGTDVLVFTFTRSGDTTAALSVDFQVSGTADASSDFSVRDAASFDPGTGSGAIVIPANKASASLRVDPSADAAVEVGETVVVTLKSDADYTPGSPSFASGTIRGTVYQNPVLHEDVNGNRVVSPMDVLILINYINGQGTELPPDPVPPATPEYYYDVDADGELRANDVLLVINYLNAQAQGGEGEIETSSAVIADAAPDRGPTGTGGLADCLDAADGLRSADEWLRAGTAASRRDAANEHARLATGVLDQPAAPLFHPLPNRADARSPRLDLRLPRASVPSGADGADETEEGWDGLLDLLAQNAAAEIR